MRRWVLVLAAVAACGVEQGEGGRFDEGGGDGGLCEALNDAVGRCGPATQCESAVAADCSVLLEVFSDGFAGAFEGCLDDGKTIATCFGETESEPTEAHAAFATAFCGQCAFGTMGCEDMFGDAPPQGLLPVRALLLALDDELVADITAACTSGASCAADFATCAQGVLVGRALPEDSVGCVIEELMSPSLVTGDCAGGVTSTSASSSSTGGSAGMGGTGGTGGSGGTASCDDVDSEPNGSETAVVPLGTLTDCNGAANVGGTLDGPGDADWYRFTGYDDYCWAEPSVTVAPDARVCLFVECLSGETQVTCPTGATADTSPEGRPGCCMTGALSVSDFNCTGTINDDVEVYVRVENPEAAVGSCEEYSLTYEY